MNILMNKNILLGITGSIAAYKAAEITSKLKKEGCDVKVVMTKSSASFITETTLESLSGNKVLTEDSDSAHNTNFTHLDLAKWADMVLIAPCTANFMNKLANGHGDDLLSTICLASTKDIFIAPAMNPDMWNNKITQNNFKKLKDADIKVIGPAYGNHACGDTGYGRMINPEDILENIKNNVKKTPLTGINVLITAGPTREPIDPVRYMSNYSSGKMGYAIAVVAKEMGAHVELISGPVSLKPIPEIKTSYIETSSEMMESVMKKIKSNDIFISTAAIADYHPSNYSNTKHKKSENNIKIEFERGRDILKTVSEKYKDIFMVGFAAETDSLEINTIEKLNNKKLDVIVGNIANHEKGLGFESDYNEVVIFSKNSNIEIKYDKKINIAESILKFIAKEYSTKISLVKSNVK
jgi:phosphopantothenoylcysteine decarboxylase/phosphopantothenate--cysteine ligase